jgi:hypothetical protein
MNIALKKVELIKWLARIQDRKMINKVEALRKVSAKEVYEKRMPKTKMELQKKLDKGRADIRAGRVYTQGEVAAFFESKIGK